MKITSKLLFISIISTFSYAETIMCFLENHKNLASLETTALTGSSCNNKSLSALKKEGWLVDDIKINNNNYIYVLKKGSIQSELSTSIDQDELEKKVLAKLERKQKEEKIEKELEAKLKAANDGKHLYVNKCQTCHGEKGTELPSYSRSISSLSLDEFEDTITNYKNGSYDRGSALEMRPYAFAISKNEVNSVFEYIQSVK
jgi:mono/diheme cytochrome c family protein